MWVGLKISVQNGIRIYCQNRLIWFLCRWRLDLTPLYVSSSILWPFSLKYVILSTIHNLKQHFNLIKGLFEITFTFIFAFCTINMIYLFIFRQITLKKLFEYTEKLFVNFKNHLSNFRSSSIPFGIRSLMRLKICVYNIAFTY